MKLKEAINWSIYNYPTLYRHNDWEKSSIIVLDHMFLGYGTGYEWHPDGFLCENFGGGYKLNHVRKTLPKGYFDKKLYCFELKKEDKEKLHNLLKEKNVFHYFRKDYPHSVKIDCIFEDCSKTYGEEYNNELLENFHSDKSGYKFLQDAECIYIEDRSSFEESEWKELLPHNMCKYSPIAEMIAGKTNSCHIDNFNLPNIQQDWLEGAIKIVKEAKRHYEDPERAKFDFYYPSEKNICMGEFELRDAIKKGTEKEHRKRNSIDTGKTIKERLEECWKVNVEVQMGYFNKFLEKFDK